ncbi:hypothetical protein BM221_007283 [Beauveria bassiana]|uniref:Uncharacterized protein n=1 Tax=Beauveria bassiana TaxID=176275 RepID=A0A2N6NGF8_BEABA|nr:hypothetical protein BM221_007283 [Beauveria bassiana]
MKEERRKEKEEKLYEYKYEQTADERWDGASLGSGWQAARVGSSLQHHEQAQTRAQTVAPQGKWRRGPVGQLDDKTLGY